MAVAIGRVDVRTSIAAAGDVIEGILVLDPQRSRHDEDTLADRDSKIKA